MGCNSEHEILKLLVEQQKPVCVVGIERWRLAERGLADNSVPEEAFPQSRSWRHRDIRGLVLAR